MLNWWDLFRFSFIQLYNRQWKQFDLQVTVSTCLRWAKKESCACLLTKGMPLGQLFLFAVCFSMFHILQSPSFHQQIQLWIVSIIPSQQIVQTGSDVIYSHCLVTFSFSVLSFQKYSMVNFQNSGTLQPRILPSFSWERLLAMSWQTRNWSRLFSSAWAHCSMCLSFPTIVKPRNCNFTTAWKDSIT